MIHGAAGAAIKKFLEEANETVYPDNLSPSFQRWARLRIPNGQIARTAWKEKQKALNKVRMSRNVWINDPAAGESYAEVQFFFQAKLDNKLVALALVSPYSAPDQRLLEESSNTLWVIRAKTISSVVGMVPFDAAGRVFAVHKMGLDVASMSGPVEDDTDS
ncbi:hypothetical protein DFH09DRAFT_1085534 [Mycena vulgaris]|nr:hypothetical protein DFH09DRAFT_1085534 [Mycena vulgaris]